MSEYNYVFKRRGNPAEFTLMQDLQIEENSTFKLKVVVPHELGPVRGHDTAILMLHGLNERSWQKYMPWANAIAQMTGVPVVMFPIAFHIDRSPESWSNSRDMQKLVCMQNEEDSSNGLHNSNLTFANYALSSRIRENPLRFYVAGRQTVNDICQFLDEVRNGQYSILQKDCKMDIFSYSIGSLLSQVLLMSNAGGYFSNSKLFMFCGGSLFSQMNGNSRLIMDKHSFERLSGFYNNKFLEMYFNHEIVHDIVNESFLAHIGKDLKRKEREEFYRANSHRIKIVALKNDLVIPVCGIKDALGDAFDKILVEMDFPFKYSHEIPFPFERKEDLPEVNNWFGQVFSQAARFLKQK
ncbi:MAG: DUF6051 family protein [Bacteroidales bacterium]|jgi:hypothetical protein